jgi:hypothetical protein
VLWLLPWSDTKRRARLHGCQGFLRLLPMLNILQSLFWYLLTTPVQRVHSFRFTPQHHPAIPIVIDISVFTFISLIFHNQICLKCNTSIIPFPYSSLSRRPLAFVCCLFACGLVTVRFIFCLYLFHVSSAYLFGVKISIRCPFPEAG